MPRIRVLVVDDSVVVRRMVSNVLSEDPALEVVGVAANGRIALQKIEQVNPDIVTMDIEMPEMDGLETLRELRRERRTLPVIMFSTLTERGAVGTLDALALGASDYVTKPANVGSVTEALDRLREELIPKIKGLCRPASPPERHSAKAAPAPRPALPTPAPRGALDGSAVGVLAIGVSTGGPNALAEVIPSLPADFPVPVLIVQHMPPVFTALLASRLDAGSNLTVAEATDETVLQPGSIWVAPGDHHMIVEQTNGPVRIRITQDAPENSCRPAVDPLFRSVARVYGRSTVGLVLTGMGHDGLNGCEHIKEAGGRVLVQDDESSVVWGMPGHVANQGLADAILPLDQIGTALGRLVSSGQKPARLPLTDSITVKGWQG